MKKAVPAVGAVVDQARSVSAAEAPFVRPARTSTTHTLEPWRDWFQNALKDVLGMDRYAKLCNIVNFAPDDDYNLYPTPIPDKKIQVSATDPTRTHMYRTPSPGNVQTARLPRFDEGEDPYDAGYFKRDTRRRHLHSELGNVIVERAKLQNMNPNDPALPALKEKLEKGPQSSPGNQGRFATGPTDFDPTGLRATMSVTWKAYLESLDKHMPDHIPKPIWMNNPQSHVEWYESRGIPAPVGDYYEDLKMPVKYRVARW